ncbi:type II toxin-antitoxin system RelE/ParE family toxin [Rothia sp. SD9660Na]|nr:type II toxin-antitoxin system RelE/ParE family toxin [Rothia sp. SD9660Na]WHS51103.1 type II toxin-antitoxin system RelE/ParE family toxin [Rothia sp. SD9660Na]
MSASSWSLIYDKDCIKALKKLDKPTRRRIMDALDWLASSPTPQVHCKALTGEFTGLWRYRIGNYRAILDLDQGELIIIALNAGHRSKIYR